MHVTNYQTFLKDLFKRIPEMGHNSLARMQHLADLFGNPQKQFPIVHVAGTNGKGQVTAKIAHALKQGGYRVGRFISPHLYDYCERITIGNDEIPLEDLFRLHEELEVAWGGKSNSPHFFECTLLYALRFFAEQKVDVAVIEAGLGGTYDPTNIVFPILSIITSIGYDHMEHLGKTINEIAAQKAGIIKNGVPLIIGPFAKYPPIIKRAHEIAHSLHVVDETHSFYDRENQLIAKKALELLSDRFSLKKAHIEQGIAFSLPCRFEQRGQIIYDVAHNLDGFRRLIEALQVKFPQKKHRFLVGLGQKKDITGCLKQLLPVVSHIHFVQSDHPFAERAEILASIYESLTSNAYTIDKTVKEGFLRAKRKLASDERLIVCGSFYIMADAQD